MFDLDLTNQLGILKHANKPNWGGPAVVQLAASAYPSGAQSCNLNQSAIHKFIQANNIESGAAGPWESDPFAVTKALNVLCPPQHSWIDVSGTDPNAVLYKILLYMAKYRYVSPICVFSSDIWMAVYRYWTSKDPTATTNPVLEKIWLKDVHFSYFPNDIMVSANTFLKAHNYWGKPCGGGGLGCGQRWNMHWIGIAEPPAVEGTIDFKDVARVGRRLIDAREASSRAREELAQERKLSSLEFARRFEGLRAGRPMLVRELPLDESDEEKPQVQYYIIPFCKKSEVDEESRQLVRVSVLINAHTGDFEQRWLFGEPIRYLSEGEAARIVASSLRLNGKQRQKMRLERVMKPVAPHVSSAIPAWQVTVSKQTLFVTNSGLLLSGLASIGRRGR